MDGVTSSERETEAVSHPAAVVRLAATAREVLAELRSGDLADAARIRADAVYEQSLRRLSALLSDGLRTELSHLVGDHFAGREDEAAPHGAASTAPSTGQLRVAEAQLAGWLDGLLQSMDASLAAQVSRAQRGLGAEEQQETARRSGRHSAQDTAYL